MGPARLGKDFKKREAIEPLHYLPSRDAGLPFLVRVDIRFLSLGCLPMAESINPSSLLNGPQAMAR